MSSPHFTALSSKIQKAVKFVGRQDNLRNRNAILKRELDFIHEMAFLLCFVAFENYIQQRFLSLLLRRVRSRYVGFGVRIQISSSQLARELMYSGREYVDFLPYDRTVHLAERFFRNGIPFSLLDKQEMMELKLQHAIRNDIAHRSASSVTKFQNLCTGHGILLPHSDLAVSRYLQTSFSVGTTRFENHVSQLLSVAQKLDR
jgi:hypothetical protein